MSGVLIPDDFADSPTILDVGAEGVCLWLCGLAYCKRHRSKRWRFISDIKVHLLYPLGDTASAAERLVAAGLWERIEGGYQLVPSCLWAFDDAASDGGAL